ncbi:beta-mannosidase [Scaptodrosophila lebanonensis]|uniref:beta-mannosidase n=1 Tax=Drosophila lebanonensis TaxID=7225 RepID=A0A6J2T318_DROLE|nr:beta-mannosidase [Scaptodrosophila lebanonensis]XP_030369683.1 beta-mannosidase [Scaptodrosophila lebanonensis]
MRSVSRSKMRTLSKSGLLLIILLCAFGTDLSKADRVEVIELANGWMITNQNGSMTKDNVKLPSGVYSAFYNEEVLNSFNDVRLRWLAYDNWTYSNNFQLDLAHYKYVRHFNLTFHGIDTVAEIRLNHQLVGRTNNMFVRYSYDVSDLLQADNLLEVEIKSPVLAALAEARKVEVPPACPVSRYHGECHMNMLRKMQASFSWDWGLAAPSMGLWKSVNLELYEVALIRDVDVDVSRNETHWNMHVTCYLDTGGGRDFYAELIFYLVELLDKPVVIDTFTKHPISHLAPVIVFDQAVPIKSVTAWWPNGYGEQKLYPLHLTLNAWLDIAGPEQRAKTVSQKSLNVGFRTIELIEDQIDSGNSFLFRVNGVDIFMKGSNYIPAHILPEWGQNQSLVGHLLQSAKDANMNMIRVWGGGVYETDFFYDKADRLGLLIWQDMMFACAMYPVGETFLDSVREEVIQNAKRLSHHPSVAIFVTNNENEAALVQNWYQTYTDLDRFKAEYRELYLANVIHELKLVSHKSRPQPLVSSPSNGRESEKDNFISDDPQNNNYGDVHFYDYMRDAWNPYVYPRARFVSEYGFQSLPQAFSWQRTKGSEDLLELMEHRQHHPMGMLPITQLVHRHLPLPLPEDEPYPEALIYFSQISQAMATKVETELYRSLRDTQHRTMGALYWQLNDVWVAPSWSGIDIFGNWKLLHYWARDFLAPIAIVALYEAESESLNISLICDQLEVDTENLKVVANVHLWSQLLPRNSTEWSVTLRPNGVQYDKVIPLNSLLHDELNKYNSYLEFQLYRSNELLSRTYYFPSSITAAKGVGDPELDYDISTRYCSTGSTTVRTHLSITIRVSRPAIFVYLELLSSYRHKFSENGFMLTVPVYVVHLEVEASICLNIRYLRKKHIKVLTVNQFMPHLASN